jgi:hypothetical protein
MKPAKRARTSPVPVQGRAQVFMACSELQSRLGKRYCDESELLPLLFAAGIVRRIRTIGIEVHPIGGDSFKVTLDAASPLVGDAKAEIARIQGTPVVRQTLFKVAVRADGGSVREDDAEPDELDDPNEVLADGDLVALALHESLIWQTCAVLVEVTDHGAVATQKCNSWSLTTSGTLLTEGQHFWEVELLSKPNATNSIQVGVSRPGLDSKGFYFLRSCTSAWFLSAAFGCLWGNGKGGDDGAGMCEQGDLIGVLLDLDDGSLLFFKNGVQHGPGYPPGSVTAPVVHAIQMLSAPTSVRLIPPHDARQIDALMMLHR